MSKAQLYTPLHTWQTRILRLHPAEHLDAALHADLLRAGLADGSYLSLSMDEPLIQFEAISYTWGQDTGTYDEIICNGLSTTILPSLSAALRRFRLANEPRYLWADALCINQSNSSEKGLQVANMFTIFNKAKCVLVWLGDENPALGEGITLLESLLIPNEDEDDDENCHKNKSNNDKNDEEHVKISPQLQQAFIELSRKPWSRRAWVQQEVYAARDIKLYCGSQILSLEKYLAALELTQKMPPFNNADKDNIMTSEDSKFVEQLDDAISHLRMASNLEIFEAQNFDGQFDDAMSSLEEVLQRCVHLEASDQRDYVYALLNVTSCPILEPKARYESGRPGFSVDYSLSASEVLQDATRLIMNSEESISVLQRYVLRGNEATSVAGLPSWVIDWRTQEVDHYRRLSYDTNQQSQHSRWRRWNWQLPNPEGSITVPGTLLAIIQSVESDVDQNFDERLPYTIAVDSLSYISHRLVPSVEKPERPSSSSSEGEAPQSLELFWVQEGYEISSRRQMDAKRGMFVMQKEPNRYMAYQHLGHVRSGDVMVHVNGSNFPLIVFLRPCSQADRFTFVCISGHVAAYLELIVGARPTPRRSRQRRQRRERSYSLLSRRISPPRPYGTMDGRMVEEEVLPIHLRALLEQETKLHREFVIC